MKHTTTRLALALTAFLSVAFVLAGCAPKPVEPGKNDKPEQQQIRKDKSGDTD
jgi:hypothetical protein